jgi:tRNA pseudouridine38-40 synthase
VELEPKVDDPAARTYRATVQYDGTNYYGFQRQRHGVPSVQAELEQALTRLVDRPIRVLGAGRTDTGVHALGQVIGFTIEWPDRHGREALQRALNANLPMDIVVSDLSEVEPGFHPRFDARRRCYEYHILNEPIRQPLWRYRAWHVAQRLDLARMNEAAALLIGAHDFATFGRPTVGDSTIREVYAATWRSAGQTAIFEICANGFLHRMVRSIVGSLKMVGSGRWSFDDFAEALAARERKRSATAAPAHGLYLVSVEYDN